MASFLTPLVRLNGKMFTRNSVAIRINGGFRITDVDEVEWDDELSTALVTPMNDNAKPLGIARGNYGCSASISIHADAAYKFEDVIRENPVSVSLPGAVRNLTEDTFAVVVSMAEGERTRHTLLIGCIIIGRPSRTVGADGKGVVLKYALQPTYIVEDDKALINTGLGAIGIGGMSPDDDALNYVTVLGVRSPGRAQISGLKVPYKWDIKEPYGRSGALMVFHGRGLAKFTLTLTFWKPEHHLVWPLFSKAIDPPGGSGVPNPFPLMPAWTHPTLAAADITAVAVTEKGQPERQPDGMWTVAMSCTEWRLTKPVLAKPKGEIPPVTPKAPVTPQTENQKLLVELRAKVEAARAAAR